MTHKVTELTADEIKCVTGGSDGAEGLLLGGGIALITGGTLLLLAGVVGRVRPCFSTVEYYNSYSVVGNHVTQDSGSSTGPCRGISCFGIAVGLSLIGSGILVVTSHSW